MSTAISTSTSRRNEPAAPAARTALPDLYRRPGFLLKRCHQVSAAIFLDECREFGVTPSQYGALRVLADYPGLDQLALGRLIGLDRSTIGLVIRLLRARRLIERSPNLRDKRRMQLQLTAAGHAMLESLIPAARRAQERVLAPLPAADRERFIGLLGRFLEVHDATIDPAGVLERRGDVGMPQAAPRAPTRRSRAGSKTARPVRGSARS